VEVNPEDAKKYGLEDGDWVNIWLLVKEWGLDSDLRRK
jgi:anaerobic selenocysteine-containing dehydrogenase